MSISTTSADKTEDVVLAEGPAREMKKEMDFASVEAVMTTKRTAKKWPELAEGDTDGYASADMGEVGGEENVAEILEEILPYIKMAREAYSDNSMADSIEMVARSQLIRGHRTDTEVHVCILKNRSVVFAFRGTELTDVESLKKDFFTDINEEQGVVELYNGAGGHAYRSSSDIRAHRGFQAALKDVTDREDLVRVVQELGMEAGDVGRVVCVGHSLGGAVATLCAKWCREVGFPGAVEIGCVTIGSPRVGNEAFAEDFERRVVKGGVSYRVVNKRDVVPCVPNSWTYWVWESPYKHVSRPIYLWEEEDEAGEKRMRSRLGGSRPTPPNIFHLFTGDHAADSYLASVRAVLEASKHL